VPVRTSAHLIRCSASPRCKTHADTLVINCATPRVRLFWGGEHSTHLPHALRISTRPPRPPFGSGTGSAPPHNCHVLATAPGRATTWHYAGAGPESMESSSCRRPRWLDEHRALTARGTASSCRLGKPFARWVRNLRMGSTWSVSSRCRRRPTNPSSVRPTEAHAWALSARPPVAVHLETCALRPGRIRRVVGTYAQGLTAYEGKPRAIRGRSYTRSMEACLVS
jgi:hypothetical protein